MRWDEVRFNVHSFILDCIFISMQSKLSTHSLRLLKKLPCYALALPLVLVIRLIRRWYLIRLGVLIGDRLGHFAANTEMYLCERDAGINVPNQKYTDLFCIYEPVCNLQLAAMWKRVLTVLPFWLMAPMLKINRLLPNWEVHEVGTNAQNERDIHNLLDIYPAHLTFTKDEEEKGQALMLAMGIPAGSRVVCIMVRDSAYLEAYKPGNWSGHDFRDSNIQNYVLTAEELAKRGYVVVRMGARVREALKSKHPRIIDYAHNGMRNDFLDLYLGSKCEFCISTGTGWDAVPAWLFRKPTVFVSYSVIGLISSYTSRFLFIVKRYRHIRLQRDLTLREIFGMDVGFCFRSSELTSKGVELIENTPEEILAATIEMVERLHGVWQPKDGDGELRQQFLDIYPLQKVDRRNGRLIHGEFKALIGAEFLRKNKDWLQ